MVRGEAFRLRAPGRGLFGVIVQADELLTLRTVLVSPTSRSAPARSFRPTANWRTSELRVLVEQPTAIPPERLGASVGRLSTTELRDLDSTLELVFGL